VNLASVGALTVRPADGIHLQNAQIESELYLLDTVGAVDPPCGNLTGAVRPLIHYVADIQIHCSLCGPRQNS